PVKSAKQREALKFLQQYVFNDKPFQFEPEVLRRLAAERWYHWGSDSFRSSEVALHDRVLGIQRVARNKLLSATGLRRIQNNALKAAKDEEALTMAEVFRALLDSIWSDVAKRVENGNGHAKGTQTPSIIRRNLQREHLKKLTDLVLGQKRNTSFFFFFDDDYG